MVDQNQGAGPTPDDENQSTDAQQGSVESVDGSPPDVEDTDDGGAIVKLDTPTPAPADEGKFYDNLVPIISSATLASLANDLDERVREDRKAREAREKQYQEGIQRTGLGNDAPGGAQFSGAARVVHPMLAKASIDFEARAIAELMPPAGPVKEYIPETNLKQATVDKAKRVAAHMNWQLTVQMPEFRGELEQCLSQVPLGGSQFMYLCWDQQRRRATGTYWPSDDVLIPYAASSAMMAERLTQVERITQRVYEQRVKNGYYVDPADSAPPMTPDLGPAARAAEKVEGVKPDTFNKDGLREVWRIYTTLQIEEDKLAGGDYAPYIVEMNADRSGVKRIIRNWEEKDELRQPMPWLIEFPFLPWRGTLSIGLAHVIGTLSGAATGALRALLDTAHLNNFPGLLKLKGANFGGQSKQMDVGTIVELEGGVGNLTDDIRKLIMPIPYNQASSVLFQLLGLMGEEAEGVVATTLKNLTEAASNTLPVGTTLALIEQGMKVFAGVHMRLLHAQTQLLRVLYRINKLYLTDAELKDEAGTVLAMRADYNGPMNVIPVADPNIFSDAQRFAQMQIVADRAMNAPDLYDRRAVEEMILERTRVPDATRLLLPSNQPKPDNAANENMAMAMGRPAMSYPEQDHLAHLQVHLDFANSPLLGQLSVIAPKFMPLVLQHIAEHVAMWYVQGMYHAGSAAVGQGLENLMFTKDPEAEAELDRLLATLSPEAIKGAQQHFSAFPQMLDQLQQIAQKYAPQPPPDPTMAVAQLGAQSKAQSDQLRSQDAAASNASREKVAQIRAIADRVLQTQRDAAAGQRQQQAEMAKHVMNQEDNQTALTIAASELAAGHKSGVSTGTGINPG